MLLSINFRFLNLNFFFLDEVDVCPWKISFECHSSKVIIVKIMQKEDPKRCMSMVGRSWLKWQEVTSYRLLWTLRGFPVSLESIQILDCSWQRPLYIDLFSRPCCKFSNCWLLGPSAYDVFQSTFFSFFYSSGRCGWPHKQLFHDISWLFGVDLPKNHLF